MSNDIVLVLVVITALAFDFTNGFHDTGNAMATSIAVGGTAGVIVVLAILAALSALIYYRSRNTKVDHNNVNAEWQGAGGVAETREPAATA